MIVLSGLPLRCLVKPPQMNGHRNLRSLSDRKDHIAGIVFFVLDSRLRYAHAIWHSFVVAGTGCHFFAVLSYSA